MNSNDIYDLIEQVAATPGKNDKVALLKAHAGNDLLKQVLAATYNPLISYGIRKVPERKANDDPAGWEFDEDTFALIDNMATRKLTGGAMLDAVQQQVNVLSSKSADLFRRIVLKNMRAGFDEGTVGKVWPGLLPVFPYMRCCLPKDAKLEGWNWAEGQVSQEKADGMFMNVNHEAGGNVAIYSRAGSMFPMEKFEGLAESVRQVLLEDTQNHGECLVLRDGVVLPREIGNGILNSVLKGGDFEANERPMFLVWDQIPLSAVKAKGKHDVKYVDRLAALIRQLQGASGGDVQLVPTRIVKSLGDAYKHYAELLAKGKEGTILKKRDAIWKDGTSKEQVKLKLEFELDLEIYSVVPGRDDTKNAGRAGSLACRTSDGELFVDVAIKGEAMRDDVDANPSNWIGKIMPVTANMIMKPSGSSNLHSLFLPRFSESTPRADKTEADTLARAFAIEEAAKLGQQIAADWKEAA